MKTTIADGISAPLARRDLVAIFAYISRTKPKCVDGSFARTEVHLDRLAAAARMQ